MNIADIFKPIKDMIKNTKNPSLSDLKQIREQLKATVLLDLSLVRKDYGQIINTYYQNHEPFRSKNKNLDSDFGEFIDLITYAVEADDSTILDKWAINHPCDNKLLSNEEISEHIVLFQVWIDEWDSVSKEYAKEHNKELPAQAKTFCAYLVHELKKKQVVNQN